MPLSAVPPLQPHKAMLCPGPNSNVVSNLVLTPLNAHKQGLHPPPLTIWSPPPSRLPSWRQNPFTNPLLPHNLETPQTPPLQILVIKLWPKTAINRSSQKGQRDLRGRSCFSYLLFPVWYVYTNMCFLRGHQEVYISFTVAYPRLLISK